MRNQLFLILFILTPFCSVIRVAADHRHRCFCASCAFLRLKKFCLLCFMCLLLAARFAR